MTELAIRANDLGKQYRIGRKQERYQTLRETLTSVVMAPVRRLTSVARGELPSIGDETIWALRDVSFEIRPGEVVGVIGRNGAGKTTLLRILSRITKPTAGRAEIRGRIGSLLEVGTGFHPELTGRENIYLNGAILGMKRAEIDRKFDEIVEFSGVEKFIETPVKRYSSGMQVRLAFAVAAHLEPDILLVDEVLAVGDAEFQRKCLAKMQDVTQHGRTVLFVSHNMAAIRSLCDRTILVEEGRIAMDGLTEGAISRYLDYSLASGAVASEEDLRKRRQEHLFHGKPYFQFTEIALLDQDGNPRTDFGSEEEIAISLSYRCYEEILLFRIGISIVNSEGAELLHTENLDDPSQNEHIQVRPGHYRTHCVLPKDFFGGNTFFVTVGAVYQGVQHVTFDKILKFDISFKGYNNNFSVHSVGKGARPRLNWETGPDHD